MSNKSKMILSYIASGMVFISTAVMAFLVLRLNTEGPGITNGEFIPIRNCMFAIGIPCFIKFYISSDKGYKENKSWLIGYFVCSCMDCFFSIHIYFALFCKYKNNVSFKLCSYRSSLLS